MLVLSRRPKEKIVFPTLGVSLTVVDVKGNTVRLGIDAPGEVPVLRDELLPRELSRSFREQDLCLASS
ncbi:MAG TPA: carbon storage regulator [Gemmatales bacterium]|nr:carbon storage regulator [Gemmatales bacterium]HMP59054.1 carbon storage regulator [Gemmatales bacterium]